jgi:hypothetical protein
MKDTLQLTSNQLIDLLGGTKNVAMLSKSTLPAVTQWRTNGIPEGKLIKLAASIEEKTCGLISRKTLFPHDWKKVWPELE